MVGEDGFETATSSLFSAEPRDPIKAVSNNPTIEPHLLEEGV